MTPESLLFHVPHASTEIPFHDGYTRPELIQGEIDKLTDWYTDKIFHVDGVTALKAPCSRVFCDMERFVPDENEPMAAKGMGFYYTHTDDGREFRHAGTWKNLVLHNFYQPHHQRLTQLVADKLRATGQCCLIDGHSFAEVPFVREDDQRPDRPDVCLGTEGIHTPGWLVDAVRGVYESAGYWVELNRPYAGSIVPLEFLGTEPGVLSIMIELNRRLYLDNHGVQKGAIEHLHELTARVVKKLLSENPFQIH